ncbi:streptophobe family protein [Streptomyces sp. NPDC057638]|uniref:streptophobe family protein n=1 Tax=Streptomyces sp. NPDC057638 TaxID=3346190 RepID=UPI0036C70F5E
MSQPTPPEHRAVTPSPEGWARALAVVAATLVALIAVAALGLWAAGAADLPDGAFPRVVAATVVLAVGGTVRLTGDAGLLGGSRGELALWPLSVTLAGILVLAYGFLRPLRHRAVVGARELGLWAGRLAALWAVALLGLAALARQSFALTPSGGLLDLGALLGATPTVGFAADVVPTLLFGLLFLAVVCALALLCSRRAPLPPRWTGLQDTVRPAAHAMAVLLLAAVVMGVVACLVVAVTQGHPAQTLAVLLLGLPNLVWLAFTLGLGATWDGRAEGPFGLPVPRVLELVLRTPGGGTLNLETLAGHDGRVWWLLAGAALLTLGAGLLLAARSPGDTPLGLLAVRMAVALVLTVFTVCSLVRVDASWGLSLLGIGDAGGALGARVRLDPRLWSALGLAVLWGLVTGLLGGLLARWLRPAGPGPA